MTSVPFLEAFDDARGPGAMRRLRILIADDDRDAAAMLAVLLVEEGYEVREVYRGDAVMRFVREFDPDVVLLDIGMPGMSGYEVARTLKEERGSSAPLLIAVTGWSKGADRVLGRIVGFDHYVTKPYDPGMLLGLLPCAALH
jgi:DNA-binding response OmpR family regulator